MSGLARIFHDKGFKVSGSDGESSHTTEKLKKEGIKVTIGHFPENLQADSDLVIYSSAVPKDNPERELAAALGISQQSYPEAVGTLSDSFSTVCVCGTHGKTTTTGMLASSLLACGQDPTVLLGSSTAELGDRNSRHGQGRYFALESCEHFRNFLHYSPKHIIVTNIELDHLDYYKDQNDYVSAFVEFIDKLPEDGLLVANGDDAGVTEALKIKPRKAVLYGSGNDNHYRIINRDLYYKGKKIFSFNLSVPGLHNVYNAAAVFALCHELNLDISDSGRALSQYRGADRRFQIKGNYGNTIIIDDYAHHPTEIAATIHAAREKYGPHKKIMCVFQPHQFSRTRFFLEDFSEAFARADHVMITDILRVRDSDEDTSSVTTEKLVKSVSARHPSVSHGGDLDSALEKIKSESSNYDIILTLGAGNIWKIADELSRPSSPKRS